MTLDERMVEARLEDQIEIANPQHPHCATVLALDTSGSMHGDKIRQLNDGIAVFRDDVLSDDLARKRVEAAVVTFGSRVMLSQGFSSMESFAPPSFKADGSTPMGEAILSSIELVRERKAAYRRMGTDYYRPWIFLVTDGEPTDMKPGDELWRRVIDEVHGGEAAREFLFFGVGVEPANMETLRKICPAERPPLQLRAGRFRDMFEWLSRSQRHISASRVGEQLALPPATGPDGWGEIATA
jgi:uncharacterized protein YegL